ALWAAEWLQTHADPAAFKPGWTYMLEAVYGNNTVIVPYTFAGLVLLGATDPRGAEVPLAELPRLAAELRVTTAVPYITGPLSQLLKNLPGSRPGDQSMATYNSGDTPPPAPAFEGWIIATADGGTPRQKLVQLSYKRACLAGKLLHPLSVWDLIRNEGASRKSLFLGLPVHFQRELAAILEALEAGYQRAGNQLLLLLERHRGPQQGQPQRQEPPPPPHRAQGASRSQETEGPGNCGRPRGMESASATGTAAGTRALPAAVVLPTEQFAALQLEQDEAGLPAAVADEGDELEALMRAVRQEQAAARSGSVTSNCGLPGSGGGNGDGCTHDVEQFHSRPAFRRALKYAVAHGHTPWPLDNEGDLLALSMYYEHAARTAPLLRALLLDCVRPAEDGSLPGYTPSPAFTQTWAKGWTQGPSEGRLAPAPPALLHAMLQDDVLERCLAPLSGRDLVAALLVCGRWRRVLEGATQPEPLAARLEAGRNDHNFGEIFWESACRMGGVCR
ncbi:hypothetical protein VOLCADRAFT_101012, partial [Volvox carteri f. nagariensis]